MEVAPPPLGLRTQELGDRLSVRIGPHRSFSQIVVLTVFLTLGGAFAISAAPQHVDSAKPAFLIAWVAGWAFFECAVMVMIAWRLFGRQVLSVTLQQLETRQEIGRFSRTKRYEAARVRDIRAAPVPHHEEELPRLDYCLRLHLHDEEPVYVGGGMFVQEAQYIASIVLARIRPPASWSFEERNVDEAHARKLLDAWHQQATAAHAEPAYPRASTPRRLAPAAVVLVVGLALVFGVPEIVRWQRGDPPPQLPAVPAPQTPSSARSAVATVADSARPFANAREYASAMTLSSLSSAGTIASARPVCGNRVTRTRWACTVPALATTGPFAGRTLTYRCHHSSTNQPGGRPAGRTIYCGPVHGLSPARTPQRR